MRARSLVVLEDEALFAQWIARVLAPAGLGVRVARDGAELHRLVEDERPDLALVDIDLGPDTPDGITCVRGLPSPPPVLFVSSDHAAAHVARFDGLTVVGYVVKPCTAEQLRASVAVALRVSARTLPASFDPAALLLRIAELVATADVAATWSPPRDVPGLSELSHRERDVLDALLRHQRVARAARALDLSEHTVRNHLKAIFAKLRVTSHEELLDRLLGDPAPP